MPDKRIKHIYTAVPRRRLGLRTLLWLVVGFSLSTILGGVWLLLILNGKMASHHSFVGQLSPDANPVVVTLPQGAILEDVHIEQNKTIQRGQTVATLDVKAMKRRIETLSAELLHDDMLRQCILHTELPDTAYFTDLPEEAQDHARLAHQDCEAFLEAKNQILERLEVDQNSLTQERDLIIQYILVLSSGLKTDLAPQKRKEDARQMLALGILRNKLERQIASLQFDSDKNTAEWQTLRLKRVRTLVKKIRSNADLRHRMEALLEHPRLQAPETGFVVQVRKVQRGTIMHEDVDLLVLRPEDGIGYQASFDVPHHKLEVVSTGDKVHLTMLGMLDGGPTLRGAITSMHSTGQAAVRATIKLDNESVARLDNPQIGVALRGLGTASIIRVQKEGIDALPMLEKIITKGILQPGTDWFAAQLFNPTIPPKQPVGG